MTAPRSGGGGFSPLGLVGQLLGRRSAPVSIDETVLNNLYERLTVAQERDGVTIDKSGDKIRLPREVASRVFVDARS